MSFFGSFPLIITVTFEPVNYRKGRQVKRKQKRTNSLSIGTFLLSINFHNAMTTRETVASGRGISWSVVIAKASVGNKITHVLLISFTLLQSVSE